MIEEKRRRGTRCMVCVYCGKCFEEEGVDAVSGATSWGDAFKALDDGSTEAPPPPLAPPGEKADCSKVDAVTGATPGVATACRELGLDDMSTLQKSLGIKPPGVA